MVNRLASVDFDATFGKVVTCKEGGIKLTLDVAEADKLTAAALMGFSNKIFKVNVVVIEPETIGEGVEGGGQNG